MARAQGKLLVETHIDAATSEKAAEDALDGKVFKVEALKAVIFFLRPVGTLAGPSPCSPGRSSRRAGGASRSSERNRSSMSRQLREAHAKDGAEAAGEPQMLFSETAGSPFQ